MNERRIHSWPYWIAMGLVALPVLYVLSFGPACWISSRIGSGRGLLPRVYRPIVTAMAPVEPKLIPGIHGGRICSYPSGTISWYASLGAQQEWCWRCTADFGLVGRKVERQTDWDWEWGDWSL